MTVEKPTGFGRAGAGEDRHGNSTDDPLCLVSEDHESAPNSENLGSLKTAGPENDANRGPLKMGLDFRFDLHCAMRAPAGMPKT
jgi:hypothetical protein